MSRHGYSEDLDHRDMAMWRGRVMSAIRGKRGQQLLIDLRDALDAMPDKRLLSHTIQSDDGCCALGAAGIKRGIDLTTLDPEQDNDVLAEKMNISECLVREIEFENDEVAPFNPEKRWKYMREWVERHIKVKGT